MLSSCSRAASRCTAASIRSVILSAASESFFSAVSRAERSISIITFNSTWRRPVGVEEVAAAAAPQLALLLGSIFRGSSAGTGDDAVLVGEDGGFFLPLDGIVERFIEARDVRVRFAR